MKPWLGVELPSRDFLRDTLYLRLGLLDLELAVAGADLRIALEIVEDQSLNPISPGFLRSQRIDGEL